MNEGVLDWAFQGDAVSLTTATASYDATSARPARGRREVAITAAPDRKERTRQPWFAVGFF
jgi:hypothetical protein